MQDDELLLQTIMERGSFDELRKRMLAQLKNTDGLLKFVEEQVVNSQAMQKFAEKNQRALFEVVRKETEGAILTKTLQMAWQILNEDGSKLRAEIENKVQETLCAIHEDRERSQHLQQ
eukprot:jgi/Botrbrau1/14851/Bobra.0326s0005.1